MRPSVNTWHNIILYTFFKETVHKHGGVSGKYKNLKMTLQWALTDVSRVRNTDFLKIKMFCFFNKETWLLPRNKK